MGVGRFCRHLEPSGREITTKPARSTRVDHPVPTIGLRFENKAGEVLAYSCDTAISPAVVDLARNADVLIHEATGSIPGVHASAEEAAETAAEAGVERLILVHMPPAMSDDDLEEDDGLTEVEDSNGSAAGEEE